MGDLSKMWSICGNCPYWEIYDPPYSCAITEQKYRDMFEIQEVDKQYAEEER